MKKIQYIQSWLLIIILALSVHGVADAKLAPASISSVTHYGIDHNEQQKYHYNAAVNIQYCCSEYADKALLEKFQDGFAVAFTRYGNATNGGGKLFRRGARDSSKLLKNQAQAAEKSKIGIHGVSVSSSSATSKAGQVVRCATCKDIESAGFKVHKTGRDPNHFTVELPKPVTKEVSKKFNDVFK